ncbi:MAG: hypothetical protein KJN59_13665, partial [Bacteroidia bacterium]|nr:hypothetical protein [Bacteroidia bacterium]
MRKNYYCLFLLLLMFLNQLSALSVSSDFNLKGTNHDIQRLENIVTKRLVFAEPETFHLTSELNTAKVFSDAESEGESFAAPTALCQNITVSLDAFGNATIVASDVDGGSSDPDNDPITLSVSPSSFDCSNIGANTVTLTVTDTNENLSSTCNAIVTIVDDTLPNAICQDVTVQLDASGNASVTAAQVDNGSNDNCGVASISVSPNTFNCANVGAN